LASAKKTILSESEAIAKLHRTFFIQKED
jgi:hypothetical protein